MISRLIGSSLELQDDEILEQLYFGQDNHLSASLGMKGGWVCGPILRYELCEDGRVKIGDDDEWLWVWDSMELSNDRLTVQCGGQAKTYVMTPLARR
ncbi:hypothetical protein [Alienimonas chondri]|uniref:hypothetical protein n=1 Tax=Alienimonas chondri TaxID=2681879 RepID=UPI001487DF92|nr:hypothetical protein [Alienimonas chondri]